MTPFISVGYILLGVMLLILEVISFGLASKSSDNGRYLWVFAWLVAWSAYAGGAFYVVGYV